MAFHHPLFNNYFMRFAKKVVIWCWMVSIITILLCYRIVLPNHKWMDLLKKVVNINLLFFNNNFFYHTQVFWFWFLTPPLSRFDTFIHVRTSCQGQGTPYAPVSKILPFKDTSMIKFDLIAFSYWKCFCLFHISSSFNFWQKSYIISQSRL